MHISTQQQGLRSHQRLTRFQSQGGQRLWMMIIIISSDTWTCSDSRRCSTSWMCCNC